MLRIFLGILLLLNALLFSLNAGWLGNWSFDTHEPERMKTQHHASQLHVLSEASALALVGPAPDAAGVPAAAQTPAPRLCLEWGSFTPAELARAEAALKPFALGERLSHVSVNEAASHMVYIPPLPNKEAADKKATELRRLGITDFFIVQDNSPLRWAISLGVFRTQEAARAHLTALNSKGVRSARIGERNVSAVKILLRVSGVSDEEKTRLEALKTQFSTQEWRRCSDT